MMAADTSDVDAAIVSLLLNDSALSALLPDGVYFDEAAQGKTRFLIVSRIIGFDVPTYAPFGTPKRAQEDLLYLVKAVVKTSSGANIKAAAARIDALLDDQALTATGYSAVWASREEPIRTTEVDEVDATIRWQHRGGRYRVLATV
jgi:hypothetical protein